MDGLNLIGVYLRVSLNANNKINNLFLNLYENDKDLRNYYIMFNHKIYPKNKYGVRLIRGGKNACGLKDNASDEPDMYFPFIETWLSMRNNIAYNDNMRQSGYFINNNDYKGPYEKYDKSCTDSYNHIHIIKCNYILDRDTKKHILIVLYSQKLNALGISIQYDKPNEPSVLLARGRIRNSVFYCEAPTHDILMKSAVFFFKSMMDIAKMYKEELVANKAKPPKSPKSPLREEAKLKEKSPSPPRAATTSASPPRAASSLRAASSPRAASAKK